MKKIVLGAIASAALAVLAFVGINAWGPPLSSEAEALLKPPPVGKPGKDNAWLGDLGFLAPRDQDPLEWGERIVQRTRAADAKGQKDNSYAAEPGQLAFSGNQRWFDLAKESPLDAARARRAALVSLLEKNDVLYRRHHAIRALPRYEETFLPQRPTTAMVFPVGATQGGSLALARAAIAATEGRLDDALLELEQEVAYHRRILAGGRTLVSRMLAVNMLGHDMAFLSDLVRLHRAGLSVHRARLTALAAPLTDEMIDLRPVMRIEAHLQANSLAGWREMILEGNDAMNEVRNFSNWRPISRWEAFGYRINETVNVYAASFTKQMSATDAIYANLAGFTVQQGEHTAAPGVSWRFVNPTGRLILSEIVVADGTAFQEFIGRMRDLAAFVGLVRLQIDIALDPARRGSLSNSGGEHWMLDKRFAVKAQYDAATSQLWFAPVAIAGWSRSLSARHTGRIAVPAGVAP